MANSVGPDQILIQVFTVCSELSVPVLRTFILGINFIFVDFTDV